MYSLKLWKIGSSIDSTAWQNTYIQQKSSFYEDEDRDDPFLSSLVLCCVSSSLSLVSTFLESSITTPWATLRRRLRSFGFLRSSGFLLRSKLVSLVREGREVESGEREVRLQLERLRVFKQPERAAQHSGSIESPLSGPRARLWRSKCNSFSFLLFSSPSSLDILFLVR